MVQRLAALLVLLALHPNLSGQSSVQNSPGAPPNPNAAIKPNPPSPATPPDAPYPDRGTVPQHRTTNRIKRAVKSVAPNCLDWLLHTCWSQPLGSQRSAAEINNPGFAHDMEIGNFYLKQKNYRGAALRFRNALESVPNEPEATFKLAKSLEKQDKADEARQQYQSFLEHSDSSPFAGEAQKALRRLETKGRTREK